jgi:glucose/arabinose dehydrogenase
LPVLHRLRTRHTGRVVSFLPRTSHPPLSLIFGLLAPLMAPACLGQEAGSGPPAGQSIPSDFPELALELIVDGLQMPLYATVAPGQPGRLYVLEKAGKIRVVDLSSKKILDHNFLDIHEKVSTLSERGLLGLDFAPDYLESGVFYIHYSDLEGDTVLARMRVDPKHPLTADPKSEEILLQVKQPWPNHDGGQLSFGPDGMLYLGLGDGGAAADPKNAAQNGQNLLGKILRLDVSKSVGSPYAIPTDNPFVGDENFRDEIWAYGLRNPWRFSFDRLTGDLWIGDIGQNSWEEIDFVAAGSGGGQNFGWRIREGRHDFNQQDPRPDSLVEPIHEYYQGGKLNARSVTGGYVYRGKSLPGLQGWYVFGDYVSGQVWVLQQTAGAVTRYLELTSMLKPGGGGVVPGMASFGQDSGGEIYLMSLTGGTLHQLVKAQS